jgi:recombining binding protein (suppressor of hairless)
MLTTVHFPQIFQYAAKFQYTFFDAFGQNNDIPEMPITPFPTLFTAPVYRPTNNTIELTVSNFFYEDRKTRTQVPLDVYLGNLGPLRHRIYQATPPGPLTNISPFVQAIPGGPSEGGPPDAQAQRYVASGPIHTIVIVEMPPLADVIKALEQDALPPNPDGSVSNHHSPRVDGTPDPRAGPSQPSLSITGRSLPLLFIRASDGVGYHSGRTIACENVFQAIDLGSMAAGAGAGNIDANWLAAAQAAAVAEGGLHGWTLRVM